MSESVIGFHIGFTGTRYGMSKDQKNSLDVIFNNVANFYEDENTDIYFHQGECVGSDYESAMLAREHEFKIVSHPPNSSKARKRIYKPYKIYEEKKYLERNRDIVKYSDLMLATPVDFSAIHRGRGGTWATIRIAFMKDTPLAIIYPDGRAKGFYIPQEYRSFFSYINFKRIEP